MNLMAVVVVVLQYNSYFFIFDHCKPVEVSISSDLATWARSHDERMEI
jgi:hypothetical protein